MEELRSLKSKEALSSGPYKLEIAVRPNLTSELDAWPR